MDRALWLAVLVLGMWDWEERTLVAPDRFDYRLERPEQAGDLTFTLTRYIGNASISKTQDLSSPATTLVFPHTLQTNASYTVWTSCTTVCCYSLSASNANRTSLYSSLPIELEIVYSAIFLLRNSGNEVMVMPLEPCESLQGRLVPDNTTFQELRNPTLGLIWSLSTLPKPQVWN